MRRSQFDGEKTILEMFPFKILHDPWESLGTESSQRLRPNLLPEDEKNTHFDEKKREENFGELSCFC